MNQIIRIPAIATGYGLPDEGKLAVSMGSFPAGTLVFTGKIEADPSLFVDPTSPTINALLRLGGPTNAWVATANYGKQVAADLFGNVIMPILWEMTEGSSLWVTGEGYKINPELSPQPGEGMPVIVSLHLCAPST